MPTPDQRQGRDRLKRYVEREGLVSAMNRTKWARLVRLFEQMSFLRFRTKYVRSPEDDYWSGDWRYMTAGWDSIEWLDIDARISTPRGALIAPAIEDHTEEFRMALESESIPFTASGQYTRIWGYHRPSKSPIDD